MRRKALSDAKAAHPENSEAGSRQPQGLCRACLHPAKKLG
jgi:hypothetical protein